MRCIIDQSFRNSFQKCVAKHQRLTAPTRTPRPYLVEGDRAGPRAKVGPNFKSRELTPQHQASFLKHVINILLGRRQASEVQRNCALMFSEQADKLIRLLSINRDFF